jgi:hypothetical protein
VCTCILLRRGLGCVAAIYFETIHLIMLTAMRWPLRVWRVGRDGMCARAEAERGAACRTSRQRWLG